MMMYFTIVEAWGAVVYFGDRNDAPVSWLKIAEGPNVNTAYELEDRLNGIVPG